MKWLVSFGLLLCIGILAGAACAAPGATPAQPPGGGQETPTATDTPTPEAPLEYLVSINHNKQPIVHIKERATTNGDAEEKNGNACKTIVDFDGKKAYKRSPSNHWLLWTFTVNFDLMWGANPIGCLQLYQRNNKENRFDLIKNGKILVDTCETEGGVTFNSGSAIFDGTGYITCGMNLSLWIEEISKYPEYINLILAPPNSPEPINISRTFTSTHTYENFTIVASIQPSKTATLLPLVYYRPLGDSIEQPALALRHSETDVAQLTADTVAPCNLEGTHVIDPLWWYENQLWWYDLRKDPGHTELYRQYVVRFSHAPADADSYERSCKINNQSPLTFSLQEAKLYIGFKPGTNEKFKGTIDAILIDPTDSKPEK